MRRGLVICAVAVTILAAMAALRIERARTVQAASVSAKFEPSLVGQGPIRTAEASSLGFSFEYSADVSSTQPGCALGPATTFCNQVPGTIGRAIPYTVTFTSAANGVTLGLAAIPGLTSIFAQGDFTVSNNTCSGNFMANASCTFDVAFSPTTTGLRQAALTINGTAFTNLAGTGVNLMVVAPAAPNCGGSALPGNAFTYCQEAVGAASPPETFTIAAASAVTDLNVTFVAVSGLSTEFDSGNFTIESTTCTGALAAGASCTVSVSFTPQVGGLAAALVNATDANDDVATLSLAGQTTTGIVFPAPITSTCRLRFFDFCNEPNGGNSAPITYTLQNTSGTQLTGVTVSPPMQTNPPSLPPTDFTVQGTTCSSTLSGTPPNNTCTITVVFTPQAVGVRQGAIGVTDAQGDVSAINLAGYSDDYQMSLVTGQQQQLNVAQGDGVTWNAQVKPDNVFGANGEQVTLVCPTNLPTFSTCAFSTCPLSMTPGTATTFNISIVTSSKIKQAPPVTSPCSESSGNIASVPGGQMIIRLGPQPPHLPWLFPALALLAAAMALAFAAFSRRPARVRWAFATAGIAAIIVAGCGGGKTDIGVTPIATTNMNIIGNALDANGNPLNAGRPLTIIIDVVQAR